MSLENKLTQLKINDENINTNYEYINEFKNPNKLPITQIHLEKSWKQLRKERPKNLDFLNASSEEIQNAYFETKTDVIPALDKRWLPKCVLYKYEAYSFTSSKEDNINFLTNNTLFLESVNYLLYCDFHQFWCTVLFEPSAPVALRSFLLGAVPPYQVKYLQDEYLEIYKAIFAKFLLVYEKILSFKWSEYEYMAESYGLELLIEKKLLNLPIVITLVFLFKENNLDFVNKTVFLYFSNEVQKEFIAKEVEYTIEQASIVLQTIKGYICGFNETAVIVPISLEKRPQVFNLSWVFSAVGYILDTISTTNLLFHFHKPAIQMALDKEFPYNLPSIYVQVYSDLYELLDNRVEMETQKELFQRVIDEINLGRTEFVDLYHTFVSFCLDEALKQIGNKTQQEIISENYLRLLQTALDEDYFVCDYNAAFNVETQNEMFASCCEIDKTFTEFIATCIKRLPRNKKLQELSNLKRQTVEGVFRDFRPPILEEPEEDFNIQAGPSKERNDDGEVEKKILSILDMFPHLGDGFILLCLEAYNFNTGDVIDAILEGNLPPHLSEIPFDQIRIPPEPEPEQPILAYRGKKPQYDDALTLLNDKKDIKDIKTLVLEGIQFSYDNPYDDEYDDRYDDDVAVKVPDNPLGEDVPTFNPNRQGEEEDSYSSSEEENQQPNGQEPGKSRMNFCEDPAVLRERREARMKVKHPPSTQPKKAQDVVGKGKGQGQDKNVLVNRQKKNVNKSSRANHNRKGGASWKRSRGMVPS